MKVELQEAYVLHTRPFRDSSLLVDVLSRDVGRVTLVAKGARAKKSKYRHLLQPFVRLSLSWQGRGSLKTLTHAESLQPPFGLHHWHLYGGLYVNELFLNLLMIEDPAEDLFYEYTQLLLQLEKKMPLEPTLRRFEFQFLAMQGYGIDCSVDANTAANIDAEKFYVYVVGQGFIEPPSANYVEAMLLPGACLIAITQNVFLDAATLKAAKFITRLAIDDLLGGKELKSRNFFKQLVANKNIGVSE